MSFPAAWEATGFADDGLGFADGFTDGGADGFADGFADGVADADGATEVEGVAFTRPASVCCR